VGIGGQEAVAGAIAELERAKRLLSSLRVKQVRGIEQRQYLRATALSWFNSRRPELVGSASTDELAAVDEPYRIILDSAEKLAAKSTYLDAVRAAKAALIALRAKLLSGLPAAAVSVDSPPNFGTLVTDTAMQGILTNRWLECTKCLNASAFLAATVMMGGLLEALLVARANRMVDKTPLFRATSAPIDQKTKKPLDLRQWTLASYIDVGHELGWISRSAKDVAVVVRDYRNYVHPEKERSHGVTLVRDDAVMFWEVVKALARQLLKP